MVTNSQLMNTVYSNNNKQSNELYSDNLLLLLDASDVSTITHVGGAVSQWSDKSGNDNHATQSTGSAQPTTNSSTLNGHNILTFDGTDKLVLPSSLYTGLFEDDNTVIIVLNNTDGATQQRVMVGTVSGSSRYNIQTQSSGAGCNFYHNTSFDVIASSKSLLKDNILVVRREGTTQGISLRGETELNETTAVDLTGITDLTLGAHVSGSDEFIGTIAEVRIYNRSLTANEILSISIELADKWGLYHPSANWIKTYDAIDQVMIHAGELNKSEVRTDANPCILDLDTSDESDFTIATGISQWNDKSGHDNHATQSSGSLQPALIGLDSPANHLAVDFDQTNVMELPSALHSLPNGSNTVIIVSETDDATRLQTIFAQSEAGITRNDMRYSAASGTAYYQSDNAQSQGVTFSQTDIQKMGVLTGYRDGTTHGIRYAGGTDVTNLLANDEAGVDLARLGAFNDTPAFPLDGRILRVLIFNVKLTAAQITQIEIALADLYKVYHPSANWINDSGYTVLQKACIHMGKLNQNEIDTTANPLINHYDPTLLSSVTLNGTTISQLSDLSPQEDHAVQATTAKQPTYVEDYFAPGVAAVYSTGADGMRLTAPTELDVDEPFIMMAVGRADHANEGNDPTTGSSLNAMFATNDATSANSGFAIRQNRDDLDKIQGVAYSIGGTLKDPALNEHFVVCIVHDGTNIQTYYNGVQKHDAAAVNTTVVIDEINYGSDGTDSRSWMGWIGEAFVIQATPIEAQRVLLEQYLANKFGVTLS